MAITLRSVGASPGANSANCIITKPAGLAVGDFMLAHVVNKATSGTITPPSGWAIVGAQSNTASSRSALFYKFADAADVAASTFTFTLGTSGRNRGEMGAWLGVNTTTPINAANQQINSAGTSIAVPTPTVTDGCTVLIFGSNAAGGIASACSGSDPVCTITYGYAVAYSTYCALACFSGVKSGTDAIDAHSLSTFTSAVSSGHAVALTPAVAPEEHSGSAAVSGNGSIVVAAQKNGKGSATGSGNGSLTGLAQKGGQGSAITSGKGTLVAIGIAAMMGLASLSGNGSPIAMGQKAGLSIAVVSGGGSITATGEAGVAPEEHSGTAAISGNGNLASLGTKAASDLAIISGNGSVIATGMAAEFHFGIATISGNGSALGVGFKAGAGAAGPISANGAQVAEGAKAASTTASVSAAGSLISSGEKAASGSSIISGNGGLSAEGLGPAFIPIKEIWLLSRIQYEVDKLSRLAVEIILISRIDREE